MIRGLKAVLSNWLIFLKSSFNLRPDDKGTERADQSAIEAKIEESFNLRPDDKGTESSPVGYPHIQRTRRFNLRPDDKGTESILDPPSA